MRLFLSALLLLASAQSPAREPVTVALGDGTVNGEFMRPYATRWKLVGRAPDGTTEEMGIWSDKLEVVTVEGRKLLRRHQVWIHDKGAEGYFNLVDAKTLAPLVSQYTNAGGLYYRFEYEDGDVRYQRSPQPPAFEDRAEEGVVRPKMPMFDFNAGMFGLLIAAFPLKEGYSARFPVFRTFEPGTEPAWVDFEVQGKERVAAGPGKEVEAWKVIVHSPATDEIMRFDLTKDPPYVIRLQQEWNGKDWTFVMC